MMMNPPELLCVSVNTGMGGWDTGFLQQASVNLPLMEEMEAVPVALLLFCLLLQYLIPNSTSQQEV